MNLRTLRALYPASFHPNQTWFDAEPFMLVEGTRITPAAAVVRPVNDLGLHLPHAVDLALAYIDDPSNPVWAYYLWTADLDHLGQRVYLGVNDLGMEIHRHLHLTDRFRVPV